MSPREMIFFILTFLTVISPKVHGSLKNNSHEYPLMQYTKLISEEYFTAGRPLVIVLPLAEVDTTNEEVGYLIEELHTSGRWSIMLYNVTYKMNGNMHTEINKHSSYIILISGPCNEWQEHFSRFWLQMHKMFLENHRIHSWNQKEKLIVSVMSNCLNVENTNFSRAILNELRLKEFMNAAVLFLKPNDPTYKDLQQNTTDSAQDTYLELHTWYLYANSDGCNPSEGNVAVNVFTVQNISDIKKGGIFKEYSSKNFHKCKVTVHAEFGAPFVNLIKSVWYNDSENQQAYLDGWEIELIKIIGKSLNVSLDIIVGHEKEYHKDLPTIYVGGYSTRASGMQGLKEYTRSYYTHRFVWYTPCNVKYHRWNRFFNIFSVDMWLCFALSLVLAVITVRCISNYGHKLHLHQSQTYSNIFSATSNIIAVLLSVSVNTQPRSTPLRLFFFCWVCYSVAISTVFQAYLTTFLIEPGYEEPIKNIDQMLISERKFGFTEWDMPFFTNTSDTVELAILENAVMCPEEDICCAWATAYHNFSTIIHDVIVEYYRQIGYWADKYSRPLLCELEDGVVATSGYAFIVENGRRLLELINDVIIHIEEGGIFKQIKKRVFDKGKMESKVSSYTLADSYSAISIRNLQTVFYLLVLGYVLAVFCFVTEIMWHRYSSKGREKITFVTHRHN
jgi:hypothetical protein